MMWTVAAVALVALFVALIAIAVLTEFGGYQWRKIERRLDAAMQADLSAWFSRHSLHAATFVGVLLAGLMLGYWLSPTHAVAYQLPVPPDIYIPADRSGLRTLAVEDADWQRWLAILEREQLIPADIPDHLVEDIEAQALLLGHAWCSALAAGPQQQVVEAIAVTSNTPLLDARLAAAAHVLLCPNSP